MKERSGYLRSLSRLFTPGEPLPLPVTESGRVRRYLDLLWRLEHKILHAADLSTALHTCLVEICRSADWILGELWMPDSRRRYLGLREQWTEDPRILEEFGPISESTFFARGVGLAGRVWATGRSEWMPDVSNGGRSLFRREVAARRIGLRAGFAIPINADSETFAVMTFFTRHKRKSDRDYVRLLEIVSSQLGSGLQQKRLQETLRLARAGLQKRVKLRTKHLLRANQALSETLVLQNQMSRALQESEEWHRLILESSLDAMIVMDQGGLIQHWNRQAESIFGWTQEEVQGKPLGDTIVPEDQRDAHHGGLERFLKTGKGPMLNKVAEVLALRRDGASIPVELTIFPVTTASSVFFTGFLRDISARKEAEEKIRLNEERLNLVVDATSEGMWDWNIGTGQVYYSPSWVKSMGFAPHAVPPRIEFRESLLHPDDRARVRAALRQHLAGITENYVCENRLRLRSGEYRWNLDRGRVVEWDRLGRPLRMVGTDTDISVRKRIEQAKERMSRDLVRVNAELKEMARTDPLTGLLNRRGLLDALSREVGWARRAGSSLIAILLDLDDFKRVNDSWGHAVGDGVIRDVARRISGELRGTDCASRIGGDEFLVLLPRTRSAEGLQVAEGIRRAVSESAVALGEGELRLTASVGMAVVPAATSSVDELLGLTQAALQSSKRLGKNRVILAGDEVPDNPERFRHVVDEMLRGDRFFAVSRSIVALAGGAIVGREMLARLRSDVMSRSGDFFRAAREHKILTVVDRNCLRECLAAAASVDPSLRIHLNVFPSTLVDVPLEGLIAELPRDIPGRFCVEVSEQQIVGDPSYLLEPVKALRQAGVRFALKEVGFGRSCLETLVFLEPQVIKIDKSCIQGLREGPFRRRALDRLVRATTSLGAEVIVDGIESDQDIRVLRDLGVRYGQGDLWGRPTRDGAPARTRRPPG